MRVVILALYVALLCSVNATDYYFSLSGDNSDGLSDATAFHSISRVSMLSLGPGDRILLKGGEEFREGLYLSQFSGSESAPIEITSYGSGRAIITITDSESGINGYHVEYVRVRNLRITGSGHSILNCANGVGSAGVIFFAEVENVDNPLSGKYRGIEVIDVYVEGFEAGVVIGSWGEGLYGFDGVLVEGVAAHGNRDAGIAVWGNEGGETVSYSHENVVIRNCTLSQNAEHSCPKGLAYSGGIIVSSVLNALIDSCVSYEVNLRYRYLVNTDSLVY